MTSPTRERVADRIAADPGVHFSALARDLDLATGQAQYHLDRLLDAGRLTRETVGGRTHYYPPGFDEWERGALALARRETARDLLVVLLANGPANPGGLADRLGVARSTVAYHVDRLRDHDVVRKERADGRVTVAVTRPAAVARLLDAAEPTAPGRFVDRFERLLDDLL